MREVVDGVPGRSLEHFFNPGIKLSEREQEITGFNNEQVSGYSAMNTDAMRQIREFMSDAIIVGHNARSFDMPIINRMFQEHGVPIAAPMVLDTLHDVARPMRDSAHWRAEMDSHPSGEGARLGNLIHAFKGTVANTHNAMDDVNALVNIFPSIHNWYQQRYNKLPVGYQYSESGVPLSRHLDPESFFVPTTPASLNPFDNFNFGSGAEGQRVRNNFEKIMSGWHSGMREQFGENYAIEPVGRGFEHVVRFPIFPGSEGGPTLHGQVHINPDPYLGDDWYTIQGRLPMLKEGQTRQGVGAGIIRSVANREANLQDVLQKEEYFAPLRAGEYSMSRQGGPVVPGFTGWMGGLTRQSGDLIFGDLDFNTTDFENWQEQNPNALLVGKQARSGVYHNNAQALYSALHGVYIDEESRMRGSRSGDDAQKHRQGIFNEPQRTSYVYGPNAREDNAGIAMLPITVYPGAFTGHGGSTITPDFAAEHKVGWTLQKHQPISKSSAKHMLFFAGTPDIDGISGGQIPVGLHGKKISTLAFKGGGSVDLDENYLNLTWEGDSFEMLEDMFPERAKQLSDADRKVLRAGMPREWDENARSSQYVSAMRRANVAFQGTGYVLGAGSHGAVHTDTASGPEPVWSMHGKVEAPFMQGMKFTGSSGLLKTIGTIQDPAHLGIDITGLRPGMVVGDLEGVKSFEGLALSTMAAHEADGYDPVSFIQQRTGLAPQRMVSMPSRSGGIRQMPWYDMSLRENKEGNMVLASQLLGEENQQTLRDLQVITKGSIDKEIPQSELYRYEGFADKQVRMLKGNKAHVKVNNVDVFNATAFDVNVLRQIVRGHDNEGSFPGIQSINALWGRNKQAAKELLGAGFAHNAKNYSILASRLNLTPAEKPVQPIAMLTTIQDTARKLAEADLGITFSEGDSTPSGYFTRAMMELHDPNTDIWQDLGNGNGIRYPSPDAMQHMGTMNIAEDQRARIAVAMNKAIEEGASPSDPANSRLTDRLEKYYEYLDNTVINSREFAKQMQPYRAQSSRNVVLQGAEFLQPGEMLWSGNEEHRKIMREHGFVVADDDDNFALSSPGYVASLQQQDADGDIGSVFALKNGSFILERHPLNSPTSMDVFYTPGDERNRVRDRVADLALSMGYDEENIARLSKMPVNAAFREMGAIGTRIGGGDYTETPKLVDLAEVAAEATSGSYMAKAGRKATRDTQVGTPDEGSLGNNTTLEESNWNAFVVAKGQQNIGVAYNSIQNLLTTATFKNRITPRETATLWAQLGLMHDSAIDVPGKDPAKSREYYSALTTNAGYPGYKNILSTKDGGPNDAMSRPMDIGVRGMQIIRTWGRMGNDPATGATRRGYRAEEMAKLLRTEQTGANSPGEQAVVEYLKSADFSHSNETFYEDVYRRMYDPSFLDPSLEPMASPQLWAAGSDSILSNYVGGMGILEAMAKSRDESWLAERGITREKMEAGIASYMDVHRNYADTARAVLGNILMTANDMNPHVKELNSPEALVAAMELMPGDLGESVRRRSGVFNNDRDYSDRLQVNRLDERGRKARAKYSTDPNVNPLVLNGPQPITQAQEDAHQAAAISRVLGGSGKDDVDFEMDKPLTGSNATEPPDMGPLRYTDADVPSEESGRLYHSEDVFHAQTENTSKPVDVITDPALAAAARRSQKSSSGYGNSRAKNPTPAGDSGSLPTQPPSQPPSRSTPPPAGGNGGRRGGPPSRPNYSQAMPDDEDDLNAIYGGHERRLRSVASGAGLIQEAIADAVMRGMVSDDIITEASSLNYNLRTGAIKLAGRRPPPLNLGQVHQSSKPLGDMLGDFTSEFERLTEALKNASPENIKELAESIKGFNKEVTDIAKVMPKAGDWMRNDANRGPIEQMEGWTRGYNDLRSRSGMVSQHAQRLARMMGGSDEGGEEVGQPSLFDRIFGRKGQKGFFNAPDEFLSSVGMSNVGWMMFAKSRIDSMMYGGIKEDIGVYKESLGSLAGAEMAGYGGLPEDPVYMQRNQLAYYRSNAQYIAGRNLAWTESWPQRVMARFMTPDQMGQAETYIQGSKGVGGVVADNIINAYLGGKMAKGLFGGVPWGKIGQGVMAGAGLLSNLNPWTKAAMVVGTAAVGGYAYLNDRYDLNGQIGDFLGGLGSAGDTGDISAPSIDFSGVSQSFRDFRSDVAAEWPKTGWMRMSRSLDRAVRPTIQGVSGELSSTFDRTSLLFQAMQMQMPMPNTAPLGESLSGASRNVGEALSQSSQYLGTGLSGASRSTGETLAAAAPTVDLSGINRGLSEMMGGVRNYISDSITRMEQSDNTYMRWSRSMQPFVNEVMGTIRTDFNNGMYGLEKLGFNFNPDYIGSSARLGQLNMAVPDNMHAGRTGVSSEETALLGFMRDIPTTSTNEWDRLKRGLPAEAVSRLAQSRRGQYTKFSSIESWADYLSESGGGSKPETLALVRNMFATYGVNMSNVNDPEDQTTARLAEAYSIIAAAQGWDTSQTMSYQSQVAQASSLYPVQTMQGRQDQLDFMRSPALSQQQRAIGVSSMQNIAHRYSPSQWDRMAGVIGRAGTSMSMPGFESFSGILNGSSEYLYNVGLQMGVFSGPQTMDTNTFLPITWERQDALTRQGFANQYAQAQWNFGFQERQHAQDWAYQNTMMGFEIQGSQMNYRQNVESMDMSRNQANRQLGMQMAERGLQRQMMMLNIEQSTIDMDLGRERELIQRGWQDEDFAYGRELAGLKFSWGQEDANRNIRLASGRQKRELIRQRDREQVLYGMDEGQADKQQARRDETRKWEDEDFNRKKSHFEQTKTLQVQLFDMQTGHMVESHQMQIEQMDMRRRHLEEDYKLENDQRDERIRKMNEDHNMWIEQHEKMKEFWQADYDLSVAKYELTVEQDKAVANMKAQLETINADLMPEILKWWEKLLQSLKAAQGQGGNPSNPPPAPPTTNNGFPISPSLAQIQQTSRSIDILANR